VEEEPQYKCGEVFCDFQNDTGVWVSGECRGLFEHGVCGESPGLRLYVGPDGNGTCGCSEGWLWHQERCYQEFYPAPALCDEGEVLNLGTRKRLPTGKMFQCITNPCKKENTFSHRSTWGALRGCHPVPEDADLEKCEFHPSNENEGNSRLKCCQRNKRLSCQPTDFIQSTGLPPSCKGKCCPPGRVYSKFQRKCIKVCKCG